MDTVSIVELDPTPAVVLTRTSPGSNLGETIESATRRVRAAVTAARVPTSGPPFARFLSTDERPRIEVGLPLASAHAVPTLRATILPGGRAATLWYEDGTADALARVTELRSWVDRYEQSGADPWVWFWTEPDAGTGRAQVVWPVKTR